MNTDDTIHQRTSWKTLTEWSVPVQEDYERPVRDCASAVIEFVRDLRAPDSLQASVRDALSEAASNAIKRQTLSQHGSNIFIRLWMMESTMTALRIGNSENGTPTLTEAGEPAAKRREGVSPPGWGFFIIERAAYGSGGSAELQKPPEQGSIDLFLYLEGDLKGSAV